MIEIEFEIAAGGLVDRLRVSFSSIVDETIRAPSLASDQIADRFRRAFRPPSPKFSRQLAVPRKPIL